MNSYGKLVLLNLFVEVFCLQYKTQYRRLRQNRNSDEELMGRYWREILPLGFFINQGAVETGETMQRNPVALRNKIEKMETEGSGGEVRRDDIAKPAAPPPVKTVEMTHSGSNERISNEESGKLVADYKEGKEDVEVKEEPDDTDKEKVRKSITCQGQKEWIQCDGPYELIRIRNAFWGRDNDYTCTRSGITHGLRHDQNCAQDESNTMTKIREACDNENVCEVVASPIYFDKTDCPDIYKYLKLEWECARSESRIKEVFR